MSSISGDNSFSDNKFIKYDPDKDNSVNVDCGNTSDESFIGNLKFEIDKNYDPASPNFVEQSGTTFSLESSLFPDGGLYNMAVRITDPEGESSIKDFRLAVQCEDDAPYPALASDSNIVIEESSYVGLFNFSVSGVTGGEDFSYAWDFNGDDVLDPFESGVGAKGSKKCLVF